MKKVNSAFKKRKLMKFFEVTFKDEIPNIPYRLIFRAYHINKVHYIVKELWEKENYSITEFKNVEVINDNFPHLTVGELKKYISDLPEDMPVIYQRIEDFYFNKNDWGIVPIYNSLQAPSYDEYVGAFTAFVDVEKKYLCITAHY